MSQIQNQKDDSNETDIADEIADEQKESDGPRHRKRRRSNQGSYAAQRKHVKNEKEELFRRLMASNETAVSEELKKALLDNFASEGQSDTDIITMTEFSKSFKLDYTGELTLKDVIQLLQRAQQSVQMSRGQQRLNKSSLPKAIKNFILTLLTIVSKSSVEVFNDIASSQKSLEEWKGKTKNMDDDAAEKVKLSTHEITGEFLITENSKRAYIGMLCEEDRFKSNYVHLSKFLVKHGIISEDEE